MKISEIYRQTLDNIYRASIKTISVEGFTGGAVLGWELNFSTSDFSIKMFIGNAEPGPLKWIKVAKVLRFYHQLFSRDFTEKQWVKLEKIANKTVDDYYKKEKEKREKKRRKFIE